MDKVAHKESHQSRSEGGNPETGHVAHNGSHHTGPNRQTAWLCLCMTTIMQIYDLVCLVLQSYL